MATDIVIYWVDGNDKEWCARRDAYLSDVVGNTDLSPSRYRDWDNLRFLFRGIEKNLSWFNKVFFVTDGQVPDWLDTENPRLKIVDHKEFIPEKYLPTFSSHPIELNLHRIEGLSEQFIVINDDCFIVRPLEEKDFFVDGKPVDILMEYPIMCGGGNTVFSQILAGTFNVVGKHFDRGEYRKSLKKQYLSTKYGKYFFYNLVMYHLPFPRFFGVLTPHFARPYLKTTFGEVWDKEEDILDLTCKSRFRSPTDVNIYLMRIWNLLKGNFVPGNIFSMGQAYFIHDETGAPIRAIENKERAIVCINDDCDERVFEVMKKKVNAALQKVLPEKSEFER